MTEATRPLFTIVSAVYNVGSFLPDFIASIEAQTFDPGRVEVIMVDDGSTDDSPQLLAEWAARRPELVTVITQENGGQGAARNTGIEAASGVWVTFPDPDDVIEPAYLDIVARFLDDNPKTHLIATHRMMWFEDKGQLVDRHPLRFMFHRNELVDLSRDPSRFQGSSPASFFRLDEIRRQDLRFDHRVRPNFEDGHFNSRYLLAWDAPLVGFLGKARYHYRKRSDSTSTLQTSRSHPGRYTAVIEHGYLDAVRQAVARHGEVPGWLASFLLYELGEYFKLTDSQVPAGTPTEGPIAEEFHRLAEQVLASFDPEHALRYAPPSLRQVTRHALAHGYSTQPWHERTALLSALDLDQKLVRLTYHHTGPRPAESVLADGEPIAPLHAKSRSLTYLGRTLVTERILWLPATRSLQLLLDGEPVDFTYQDAEPTSAVAHPGRIRWWLNPNSARTRSGGSGPSARNLSSTSRRAARLADSSSSRKYAGAWVLIDRIHDAGDSAEILFRHLRENHPDINAWFVLEKGGPEWRRFKKEGHGDRLVAHGSLQWRLLMANAAHLLSSHADQPITSPGEILEFTKPGWRFHFLQHGVIKDDLSSWLNPKQLDTFVTSTSQEHASIAGDDTPYRFTTRETAMTGLPRFDRLRTVGLRFPAGKRDLLLVAPTWRNHLLPPLAPGSQRREVDLAVLESDFARQWTAYLSDPRLADLCRSHGLTLGFLPHPNLQPLLPHMKLPAHVKPLAYEGNDVQEYFARAAVLVTDFSSVAFNAAYLERPVVYFQFDEEVVLGGGHVGRAGYFDYRRDGFGPVEVDVDRAVRATTAAIDNGPDPTPEYQARIELSFPERDGQCCERVVQRVLWTARNATQSGPEPTPIMPPATTAPA